MYFQEQKPGVLFRPYDHRQSQSHEVPVKLHIWEIYFQGKCQSVRGSDHKNNPFFLSFLLTQFSFPSFLQQLFPRFHVLRQFSTLPFPPRVTTKKKKKNNNSSVPLHLGTIPTTAQLQVFCGLRAAHHTTCCLIQNLVRFPVTSVVYICTTAKASSD